MRLVLPCCPRQRRRLSNGVASGLRKLMQRYARVFSDASRETHARNDQVRRIPFRCTLGKVLKAGEGKRKGSVCVCVCVGLLLGWARVAWVVALGGGSDQSRDQATELNPKVVDPSPPPPPMTSSLAR